MVFIVFFDGLKVFLLEDRWIKLLFRFGVVEGKCLVCILVVFSFFILEFMYVDKVVVFVLILIVFSYLWCEELIGGKFCILCFIRLFCLGL